MRVCLMVEGQEDVTWEQWLALAGACEAGGLEGLFRSDHYSSVSGRFERGSLDAWTTLAALAARTSRIRLGTLVSPVTFRHPSVLAKTVATVDQVSGGRAELGIGAGWLELEHRAYGFEFPESSERLSLLAEQIELVHRQWTEESFDHSGRFYRLEDCRALPKPVQQPRPTLIVGGSARRGTVEPAVRFADEYDTFFASTAECRERRKRLDEACERAGRDPASLVFSLMTPCVVGSDRTEVAERIRQRVERSGNSGGAEDVVRNPPEAWIAGTPDEVAERLRELEDAGVERVFCQHLVHEDLEMVYLLGREVATAVG